MGAIRPGHVRGAAVALVLTLAVVTVGACSALRDLRPEPPYSVPEVENGRYSGTLAIGGATTQEAAMVAWGERFAESHRGLDVGYEAVGSGQGREDFVAGRLAIAGSDVSLVTDPDQHQEAADRCGADPIEVPVHVRPIQLVYRLPGVDDLNLSPEAVAAIFTGEAERWDDPLIAATNPDARLPRTPITPVHRSDASGTTGNLTDYLATVAGNVWRSGAVETWPEEYGGTAAEGTSGVADAVRATEGAIGYVAAEANRLGVARIGVGGEFTGPGAGSAAEMLTVSPRAAGATDSQLVYDLDHTAAQIGTYPIALVSYLIACPTYEDGTEAELVRDFLAMVLSTEGQELAADRGGSAPLPDQVREPALELTETISRAE